jgi:ankyrin repeat protein
MAAHEGHVPVLDALQSFGAPMTEVDESGRTIAHVAAAAGHTDFVTKAFLVGVDFAAPESRRGATVGHFAARSGHVSMLELLSRADGVDLDAMDHEGLTLRHYAAKAGHTQALDFLTEFVGDNEDL